jgi:hypothetical protein
MMAACQRLTLIRLFEVLRGFGYDGSFTAEATTLRPPRSRLGERRSDGVRHGGGNVAHALDQVPNVIDHKHHSGQA